MRQESMDPAERLATFNQARVHTCHRDKLTVLAVAGCGCRAVKRWFFINEAGKHDQYLDEIMHAPDELIDIMKLSWKASQELDHSLPEGYTRAIVVRCPYAHILSKYWHIIVDRGWADVPGSSFEEFVRVVSRTPDGELNNHWDVVTTWLRDAGISLGSIGHILHLERLTEEFPEFCRAIGKRPVKLLNHDKARGLYTGRTSDYYTEELAGLVYGKYRADFEAFGYGKDDWR